MAAIQGLRGTGDWGSDERPQDFRNFILFRNPNGSAPIFALTGRTKAEACSDPQFHWWDEPNDLLRMQVAGALGSGDSLVTIDTSDPSVAEPGNTWGEATHLVAGDLLLVEPSADNATFDHEVIEVASVQSATQFTVLRGRAGTTPAAIANDAFLTKIGTSFAEGTAAPASASRNPIKYENFTQIFKTTYEVTGTADATEARTGDARTNDKRRKSFDHARDIEMAFLFGQGAEVTGSNGKPQRTMKGIRPFIAAATTTILAANWTIANSAAGGNNLLDAISPVFDFDTPAGDQRIAFCGNNALNRINAAIHKATNIGATSINFTGKTKAFGMTFQDLTFPQGTVLLKTHPLMNRHALYRNSMFILDMSAITWRPLRGRDTKSQDDIQNKDEDVRRGSWMTEGGIELTRGGLTCGYIGGFGNTIA
jgi:hypothetical protein